MRFRLQIQVFHRTGCHKGDIYVCVQGCNNGIFRDLGVISWMGCIAEQRAV